MVVKSKKVPVKRKKQAKTKRKAGKSITKATEAMTPLASLREEIDNLFDRFSEDWPSLPRLFGHGWTYPVADLERRLKATKLELTPRVDVTETNEAYDIAMELPGMTEEQIEVSMSDDSLSVKGEKKSEHEEKKKNYHISERSYGSFQRTFRIPSGVDRDSVEASYTKGILNISLPKTEEAKQGKRSIEVKAE